MEISQINFYVAKLILYDSFLGKPKELLKGVYLSDETKTKAIKISHDRLSARLDIETFETVATNIAVTAGINLF